MISSPRLLTELQREVTRLHTDLRARCDAEPSADAPLKAQYDAARASQRTALTYKAWREEELTNVAVAWVLACVFIRFLEDNALVETLHLAGPDAAGIGRARDQQIVFFREHPGLSEREYLEHVFTETAKLPGMADLFDRRHNPLWTIGPTGDAARAFIEFWRRTDAESGRPVHDFSDPDWNTRFLGDLYQDLSEAARKRYALLQTPVFIEQFILDRTLTPAIETFGFREVRLIDPTCGSGHFLLGGFARLFALWNEALPGEVPSVIAQHALDQVFGVDLNPNVVAIARFRLLLAALRVSGVTRLRDAFDFKTHVAAGDSLLHGRRFRASESFTTGAQRTFDTEEVFRDELKHHYEVEDVEALHRILGQQYHAVVGNPPYITVKDKAVSELYRARFPSCSGKYSLSVPFMERFFDLAVKGDGSPQQPAGYVGKITANSFMKRKFGKKLIEEYLPRWDLTHVLDTSGAYIPGHGTPTVILFGKNQPPLSSTIRTVLGIRGEPATPSDPAFGIVWQAICRQIDLPGSNSEWVSAADSPAVNFHTYPWSIGGGGAAELKEAIDEAAATVLGKVVDQLRGKPNIGITAFTLEDDAYIQPDLVLRRHRLPSQHARTMVDGNTVRDWAVGENDSAVWPYDEKLRPIKSDRSHAVLQFLWPARTNLSNNFLFGQETKIQAGLNWYEFGRLTSHKLLSPLSITWGDVSTLNHFVLDRGGKVFNRHAPIIKLRNGAGEAEHVLLLGTLNSSVTCFWLKQVCHNKGDSTDKHGARTIGEVEFNTYEFDGGKVAGLPIPEHLPKQLPTALVQTSTALQGQSPAATLASWVGPESGDLRPWLASARDLATRQRRQLIAWQEELDWQIYEAFGLVEAASPRAPTAGPAAVSLPEGAAVDAIPPEGLELGQRAFEIVLARKLAAGEAQSTWFERHGSTPITEVPRHWPAAYRELVEHRIARIAEDPAKRTALRNDDRLIKTLLLAALAPEVESLKNMTPQRLAALNHGTIKSFIPGQEANEVLRKCKEWAAHGGALQVQDGVGGTQTISIRITGVDLQPILENAENVDNYGNKVARLKMLVFEALGMPEHQELFFRHEFRWRGTDRQAEVCFGNIREISDDQLEARGEEWKVVIDYPFDRDGHNLNEDLDRLETFRATFPAQHTICWIPSFLNHEAQKAIGTLVRLEHILSENRFKTFVAHLSEQDQAAAKPLLQNQRDQLHNQLRNQIEALYGLRPAMPQYADTTNQLDQADHFQALCELKLKPPVAPNLRDALNGLLNQALEFQNPGHPTFEDETRFTKANVSKVLEVFEQSLATTEPSVGVADSVVRKLARQIANPLRLGVMHENRFEKGHHWRQHFAQRQAREAGQPVTVAKLRAWIDEPVRMGLPRLAQDLVIRAWAEQTNHSFAIGTASVPPPVLGELQDDMTLREVALPSGDEWKQAVERVKALFGFDDTSPLVNANNVSVLCAKVRARIEELLPNSQLLEAELDKTGRLFGLEPRSFSRVQTTSEAVVLLKALKNTVGELPFVKALVTHQLATKPLVLSHSMKTATHVTRAVETIQWALFKALQAVTDARATSAKALVAELSDAFTRDEIAVGFQAKSTDLVNRAVELLAATPAPPPLPPGPPIIEPPVVIPPQPPIVPQPPPITKRVRRSQIKEDGIPPWVPEDQRSLALVEVNVPRATGGTEQIVVTGTTARLIEMAGDAIYEAGKLRFPKWGCEVEVETRTEE